MGDSSSNEGTLPARSYDRLRLAPLLVLLAVCGVGVFISCDLYNSHHRARRNYQDAIRGLELVGQLQYQMQETRRIMLYALATKDSNQQVQYADQSRSASTLAATTLNESVQLAKAPAELDAVHRLEAHWRGYLDIRDGLIATVLEGRPKTAVDRDLAEGVPAFSAVRDDLQSLQALFKAKSDRLLQEAEVSFRASLFRLILILCLTVALATAALKVIQKSSLLRAVTASEAQLRRSREKFATLVNSIDGVVWEAHPETFRFTFVSRQGERLLGLPVEQWLSGDGFWEEHVAPADRERVLKRRRESVARREPFRHEYRMTAGDGREVWVCESAAVVTEADKPVLLRGVLMDITEQKLAEQKLQTMHAQLVTASRQAGMAEIATGVLHNVGNVLNSVNVSANLLHDHLRQSRVSSLTKAVSLLRTHSKDLKSFLFEHPKGVLLPKYLIDVTEHLDKERQRLLCEAAQLTENVGHIKEIVAMQQTYAKVGGVVETLPVAPLVEDALQLNLAAFSRHGIEVVREFEEVPPVAADRHKVLQILVNLANNAKEALDASSRNDKKLLLRIASNGDSRVRIVFQDNGPGIPPENLTRIFVHGFTTKPNGHGFGLHNAALAAKEMGGSLTVQSEGSGNGATFMLELPRAETKP